MPTTAGTVGSGAEGASIASSAPGGWPVSTLSRFIACCACFS